MINKKQVYALIFIFLQVTLITAITGSIGNARMILRGEVGDEIQKSILVKNVNDIPLKIETFPSGDLKNSIEILDNNFTLQPDEQKKANFILKITKSGTTESNINIKFTPEDGNGVGLSSTVIVIAKGNDSEYEEEEGFFDNLFNKNEEETQENQETENNPSVTGSAVGETNIKKPIAIAVTGTIMILFITISLLYYLKSKKQKEEETKSQEDSSNEN